MGKAISGLFGGTKQETKTNTTPWSKQQPFLTSGFRKGFEALNGALTKIPDNLTAGLTDEQRQAVASIFETGMKGGDLSSGALSLGQGAQSNLTQAGENANDIYQRFSSGATDRVLANAGSLGGDVQPLIDAAIRDSQQVLARDQAGINSAAVGGGNINSTRAAALDARAMDNAQDRVADVSANLRFQNQQSALDRAMALDSQELGAGLSANQQILGAGSAGLAGAESSMGSGIQFQQDAFNAASAIQQQKQKEIQDQLTAAGLPLDFVQQYMQAIGGSYGGTSKGYQPGPSVFQQAGGLYLGLKGL